MGSSPTGHPTKKSADALHRRIFLFGGRAQWGSNKAALTHRRQSNQQPSGLLVSLRVPISRNVYQDKCCADALHRRIFYLVGCPVGSNKAALTHQRQSNQQPSGLLVSLRVPISRNVYQDKCCADALHRRIFYLVGCPVGSNKAALTHQRQSNQQPSGLLVSLRVPISRNVYQDKCCADALHRRFFLFGGGIPVGLEQHGIIFC